MVNGFWYHDGDVIYILQWKTKRGGNIKHACLGKQRGIVN